MNVLRDSPVTRLLAALAGVALYLQLAFAGSDMLASAAPADPIASLAEHALCLAGASNIPAPPADGAPTLPGHDHSLFCCLWHPLPGVAPQAALTPLPIAYTLVALGELSEPSFVTGPHRGPANARAPPPLA